MNQAVVALNDSAAAKAVTLADLKGLKFGARWAPPAWTSSRPWCSPRRSPTCTTTTNGAKSALTGKQIDAIVVDLPTAFYITAAEIEGSKVVGQFPSAEGGEQFGLLFEKGSKLTSVP